MKFLQKIYILLILFSLQLMVFSVTAESGSLYKSQAHFTKSGKSSDTPVKLLGAGFASEETEEDDALEHPQLLPANNFFSQNLFQSIIPVNSQLGRPSSGYVISEKPIYLLNQFFRI